MAHDNLPSREGEPHVCDFREEYYGHRCSGCGVYYPFGCAPWDIADDGLDDMDDWQEER